MMSNSPSFPQPSLIVQTPIVLTAAFLIGIAAYWFPFINIIGSCSVGSYAHAARVLILLLLGLAGGVLRWKRIPTFGGIGLLSGWVTDIFLSLNWPTTFHCSHQLLPFEAIFLYIFIALPSWLGFSVGKFLAGYLHTKLPPSRLRSLAYALIALSGVITLLSSNLLPMELRAKEQRALVTISALAGEQFAFQATHPKIGFSCNLKELSKEFSTTWPTSNKNGKIYENAYESGYSYRLWCYQDATPRVNFAIEAAPFCVPDCGNVTYCVNRTGKIQALSRSGQKDWSRNCWDEGTVVRSVSQ